MNKKNGGLRRHRATHRADLLTPNPPYRSGERPYHPSLDHLRHERLGSPTLPKRGGLKCPQLVAFLTSTTPTAFTRLLARIGLPSRSTSMLRTISPPPGMAQVWNFSVLGSKRTMVLGRAADSQYQMPPLVAAMP